MDGLAAGLFRWRRRLGTALGAVLVIVMGYYVVVGQNGVTAYHMKKVENRNLAQQIEQLKAENAALKAHVDRLQNDPDAIEHEAREKLHYSRPGEVIYTLNDPPSAATKLPPDQNTHN